MLIHLHRCTMPWTLITAQYQGSNVFTWLESKPAWHLYQPFDPVLMGLTGFLNQSCPQPQKAPEYTFRRLWKTPQRFQRTLEPRWFEETYAAIHQNRLCSLSAVGQQLVLYNSCAVLMGNIILKGVHLTYELVLMFEVFESPPKNLTISFVYFFIFTHLLQQVLGVSDTEENKVPNIPPPGSGQIHAVSLRVSVQDGCLGSTLLYFIYF